MKKTTTINFCALVYGEMIPKNGEDYFSKKVLQDRGYIGVFDGCGGMGAKRYENLDGKTGAYTASRAVAQLTYLKYQQFAKNGKIFSKEGVEELQELLKSGLQFIKKQYEDPTAMVLKGGLAKDFPTTVATVFFQCGQESKLLCNYIWAGDSRGYMLNENGLAQMTADDVDEEQDAFSNLTNDARLENVVYASEKFKLNYQLYKIAMPCIVLCATDGVFGYLSTPMEFEYLLLQTLMDAENVSQWEANISKMLQPYASDDFTLLMAAVGYKNFRQMQESLRPRMTYLYESCIWKIQSNEGVMSRQELYPLWQEYRKSYERYMK